MHKVGDIVVLNSGGPRMTVVAVQGQMVTCAWYLGASEIEIHEGHSYSSLTVPGPCLTLIQLNPATVN